MIRRFFILIVVVLFIFILFVRLKGQRVSRLPTTEEIQRKEGVPVEVTTAKKENIEDVILITGTVFSKNEVNISSRVSGRIRNIYVDEGDTVRKGQLIVDLYSEDIEAQMQESKANLTAAKANFENSLSNLNRMKSLYKEGAISSQQMDSAQTQFNVSQAQLTQAEWNLKFLKEQLKFTRVSSPISGYVSQKLGDTGEVTAPGVTILVIVDINNLEVRADLSEKDREKVKIGNIVRLKADAFPESIFYGKIVDISHITDLINRTFTVKIKIDRTPLKLSPGMFTRGEIITSKHKDVLVVSSISVIEKEGKKFVLTVSNNVVIGKEVVTGITNTNKIEIIKGINEGDLVVTTGIESVKDKDKVKIVGQD